MSNGAVADTQKTFTLPGLTTEFYVSGNGVYKKSNNECVFIRTTEGWIGITKFAVNDTNPTWTKILEENYAG